MVDANPKREQTKDSMNYRGRSVIVAAFTDNAAYQVLRIIQGRDGSIYFVRPMEGIDGHLSYHASGEFLGEFHEFISERGRMKERVVIAKRQPLSRFRGIESIGTFAFVKMYLSSWKQLTKPKERKSQMILCINVSHLPDTVNISCFFVEKERVDLLPTIVRFGSQILIDTVTNPWIALLVQ